MVRRAFSSSGKTPPALGVNIELEVAREREDVGELAEQQVLIVEAPGLEAREALVPAEARRDREEQRRRARSCLEVHRLDREADGARIAHEGNAALAEEGEAGELRRLGVGVADRERLDRAVVALGVEPSPANRGSNGACPSARRAAPRCRRRSAPGAGREAPPGPESAARRRAHPRAHGEGSARGVPPRS